MYSKHGSTVWDVLQGQIREGDGPHMLINIFSLVNVFSLGACDLYAVTEKMCLYFQSCTLFQWLLTCVSSTYINSPLCKVTNTLVLQSVAHFATFSTLGNVSAAQKSFVLLPASFRIKIFLLWFLYFPIVMCAKKITGVTKPTMLSL